MKLQRRMELEESIRQWLDTYAEIFNDIREEWIEYRVIRPVDNPVQKFTCNHCGKCCKCDEFAVDCYPPDIELWLSEERYDIICALMPISDEDNIIKLGFLSQRNFHENINWLLDNRSIDPSVKRKVKRIRDTVKKVNPGYNPNSDYCIYYNPNTEKHCMIYDVAPISCRAYPFDYKIFTKINIPANLSEKYGINPDVYDESPLCPPECFDKNNKKLPTECTEEDVLYVMLDKINYLTSTILEEDYNDGIVELFIETFGDRVRPYGKRNPQNKDRKEKKEENSKKKGGTVKISFGGGKIRKIERKE